MDSEELIRRLPEILKIQDDEVFNETIELFLNEVPEYFWTAPASTSGKYHPEDETSENGLWLHTKRVFTVYERLIETALEQRRITEEEADLGRVAVLLHDSFRLGDEEEENEHTVNDHGIIAADAVRDKTSLPETVAGAIEAHDGAWGKGKAPTSEIEDLVHYADMTASERGISASVINPHEILFNKPTVNVKEYVGLPRYEAAVDEVSSNNSVYVFGCLKTGYGWRILLESPYEAKDDIKELENRWWRDDLKMWLVKREEYDLVSNKLREDGWDVRADSRVEDFINEETV